MAQNPTTWKKLESFSKFIPAKKIKVKKERELENRSNSHKYYIYPQFFTCPNIMFAESAAKKEIVSSGK